jgi:YfiH family protein
MSESLPIIRPTIFQRYSDVLCGVSTRHGGVSPHPLGLNLSYRVSDDERNVTENRRRFFRALAIEPSRLAFAQQCHSNVVVSVRESGEFGLCDGLLTTQHGVWLAVSVADCVPIFLYDPVNVAVGAIHAGWRGTRGEIVKKGIGKMEFEFGTRPENIVGFIGAAAGSCCYIVGEEVAEEFDDQFILRNNGALKLDLKGANKTQLLEVGLSQDKIEMHPDCTICKVDTYHSYRRDKERSGRMMGVIGIHSLKESSIQCVEL